MQKLQRQQSTAHIPIVKEDTTKCYKHTSFFQTHTLMFIGVINLIGSIPQIKNQTNYLQNKIIIKTQHNGLFFSHKK